MLVYLHLLCFCSGLTQASSVAVDDAILDPSLLEANVEDVGSDSDFWQPKSEFELPTIYGPLKKSISNSSGSTRRIVGGRTTSVRRFPYTVAIIRNGDLWCGGALIERSWVLTAAHCMKDLHGLTNQRRLIGFKVRAGSSYPDHGGILTQIRRAFFPRQYQTFLANFDYCLLLLRQELPLGNGISLVRLPTPRSEMEEGKLIVVTGWGSTAPSGQGNLPSRLRYVTIPIVARSSCQRHYYFPITANMICASYPEGGMDACNHDSGGPATYKGYIVGIVSFGGRLCGDPRSPGVYSRVSKATKWIEQVIKQMSRQDLSPSSKYNYRISNSIGKRKKKRTYPTRYTKRSSTRDLRRGHVFKELDVKLFTGASKDRHRYINTGVYIKRIGEERKKIELQPTFRENEFSKAYQNRDDFVVYDKVPVRKGYGRKTNFISVNISNNFTRDNFYNVIEPTGTSNLTDVNGNQDEVNGSVDPVAHSSPIMRRIHEPKAIQMINQNGDKSINEDTNVTGTIWTGDHNQGDHNLASGEGENR